MSRASKSSFLSGPVSNRPADSQLINRFVMVLLLFVLLPCIIGCLPNSDAQISPADRQSTLVSSDWGNQNYWASEVQEAKLRITRLESILEERIGEINSKSHYCSDCEKKIDDLNAEIDHLKTIVSGFQNDHSNANQKIAALEEEVRLLWATSRKSNIEIYSLESMAVDAERRLKEVTSKLEEMSEIVTEQWIQIQRLEQAVQMAQIRTSKVKMELWKKCPFVKFFIDLFDNRLKALKEMLDPYSPRYKSLYVFCKTQASKKFAEVKQYHHQGFIIRTMQNNEITAALAHKEFFFLVVSALVAFPIMAACMVLLSQFN